MDRRSGYPYGSTGSVYRGRREREPKSKAIPMIIAAAIIILLLLGAGIYFTVTREGGLASLLPFPKKLAALQFQHNGQELLLLPDQQVVVNPRDSLQLVQIKTDGWLSWGTRVVSAEIDAKKLTRKPVVIRDLFAQETFEVPKHVELRVLLWNRQIGRVSFVAQLDAKDWIQKASSTSDVEKRISYLSMALWEHPADILAKTQLAGLYFDTKKYAEAAKLYKEIDESGKSKNVSERLLLLYQVMNRVDDALLVYIDLINESQEQQTFKEFISYLKKKKSKDESLRFFERHQQEFPKAFQSSILLQIAELSGDTKNWSRAAVNYEKALKAGVNDSDILYNLFVSYKKNDDTGKAIQALEKYLQKNSGDIESWLQLAELYEKKGNAAQAKSTYESILQKHPQNKEALTHLLALLEKSRDKAALQDVYEKLVHSQPSNRTLLNNLGVLYYEAKKYEKAINCFQAVAALDPKDAESRKYLLDIYRKLRDDNGQVKVLKELAKMDPRNAGFQDAIFKYYDDKKDYKGMSACFGEALRSDPDSVRLHNYQLHAAMKLGDKKSASKELEHLIRLQPKETLYLRKAADLYEGSGNIAEALKKLDSLLKLDPKNKQAKEDYLRLKMTAIGKKSVQE